MLKRLKVWGESWGQNIFVANWDIGHPNYMKLRKILQPVDLPMILFTDTDEITEESFKLLIDDPALMKQNDRLCELLPKIANLIMNGDHAKAIKEATVKKRKSELRDIIHRVTGANFKVTVSGFGASLSIENK
jgi:hypothetical protein